MGVEIEMQPVGRADDSGEFGDAGTVRHRNSVSLSEVSLDDELPLPVSSYGKLDILSQRERVWVNRLVVSSLLDIGISFFVSLLCFSIAYRDVGLTLWCMGLQVGRVFAIGALHRAQFNSSSTQ